VPSVSLATEKPFLDSRIFVRDVDEDDERR
jgi:hypothetical protein